MIFKLILPYIYKIGFDLKVKPKKKFQFINDDFSKHKIKKISFGSKNPQTKFYVIKRSPGGGFFSNLLYVLHHLKIADQKKMHAVIDMENFPTNYNQKNNINKTKNVWEIWFKQVSNYSLRQVYQSKNVYFSPTRFVFFLEGYKRKALKKIFDKYIYLQPKINNDVNKFVLKYFKDKRVLGIHMRGTDQKISARHSHPPTIYQVMDIIDYKIENKLIDKIFLLTEDLDYYEFLKKRYGKLICYHNVFRGSSSTEFSNSKRQNHRNRLGIENLIEAITLSKCNELLYCETNISLFSIFYSNFKIKKIHINMGVKSSNILISRFSWYLLIFLPHLFKNYLSKVLK